MLVTDFLSEYDEIIEQLQNFDSSISKLEALKIAIEISKSRFIEGIADNLDIINENLIQIKDELDDIKIKMSNN
jgi:hypothetical protein